MSSPQDPLAERLMLLKDYAGAHRRITEIGVLSGFGGGGLFTWGIYKFNPAIRRNILFLTFFTSSALLTVLSTHQLLSESTFLPSLRTRPSRSPPSQSQSHTGLYTERAGAMVEDDLSSWKRAEGMDVEAGVGGMEGLHDKYASTRGDH